MEGLEESPNTAKKMNDSTVNVTSMVKKGIQNSHIECVVIN